jgi:glycosyltransferase involved in cell wall biosynthesis
MNDRADNATRAAGDPDISVIVCAYNRAPMLDACLRSVRAQDHPSFEVIVMDDASNDGALGVARRHATEDPRVRVFTRGENAGSPVNIAEAHRHARGRLVGWVDSDDLILPDCLSACAAVLDAKPGVGCVYTDQMVIDAHNRPVAYGHRAAIPYSSDRLLIDFMTFHFRLYRRALYDRVGGIDTSMRFAADYDLCLRLSEVTEFERIDRPLYLYRQHAATISAARRLDQIRASADAVRRALVRRGMDGTHRLDVELIGRFQVVPRSGEAVAPFADGLPPEPGSRPADL